MYVQAFRHDSAEWAHDLLGLSAAALVLGQFRRLLSEVLFVRCDIAVWIVKIVAKY
jgi:hypothetical protein